MRSGIEYERGCFVRVVLVCFLVSAIVSGGAIYGDGPIDAAGEIVSWGDRTIIVLSRKPSRSIKARKSPIISSRKSTLAKYAARAFIISSWPISSVLKPFIMPRVMG